MGAPEGGRRALEWSNQRWRVRCSITSNDSPRRRRRPPFASWAPSMPWGFLGKARPIGRRHGRSSRTWPWRTSSPPSRGACFRQRSAVAGPLLFKAVPQLLESIGNSAGDGEECDHPEETRPSRRHVADCPNLISGPQVCRLEKEPRPGEGPRPLHGLTKPAGQHLDSPNRREAAHQAFRQKVSKSPPTPASREKSCSG